MTKELQVKNKGGRPPKNLDTKLIHDLAAIHCTKEEIATICGCSRETLYAKYSDVLRAGEHVGKRSLRRLQWQQAEKGSDKMLIWLGKQWLGQRDSQPDELPQTIIQVQVNESP